MSGARTSACNVALGTPCRPPTTLFEEIAERIALFKSEVEKQGRMFDPMSVGLTRSITLILGLQARVCAGRRYRADGAPPTCSARGNQIAWRHLGARYAVTEK